MRETIELEGVRNFRDFGGYETGDGRRVVKGELFRAAHFNAVTEGDIAKLDGLGVRFMVDLRHADERGRVPNLWSPARVLTQADGGEHVAAVEVGARDAAARGRMKMIEAYAYIPYGRRFTALFGEYFRTLAEEGGPVIVHCAIGKDRTGILSALTLSALGVARETVMSDFLATNAMLSPAEANAAHDSDEGAARRAGVAADYLQASFDVIARKSATLEAYFEDYLGVTAAQRARLRERLLV